MLRLKNTNQRDIRERSIAAWWCPIVFSEQIFHYIGCTRSYFSPDIFDFWVKHPFHLSGNYQFTQILLNEHDFNWSCLIFSNHQRKPLKSY